ncbi:MAG: TIGR00730 family Rossman fold protein [Acidobacteria bacterium]|nr:TIGR00730 family Rossman fold protein [Acidobacteriota bacterium]
MSEVENDHLHLEDSGSVAGSPTLADKDPRFLGSPDARALRILAEYLEPSSRLRRCGIHSTVVFFGSARILPKKEAQAQLRDVTRRISKTSAKGKAALKAELKAAQRAVEMSRYYEDARTLSRRLTRWSLSLNKDKGWFVICSGGGSGIMEAANRGAKEAGGKSIGFNISLPDPQPSNQYTTPELNFMFRYFFMRKLWFAQPAQALIVFPGGFGTMDELWEIVTLMQTRKLHQNAVILLYGSKFWKKLVNFRYLIECGTIDKHDLSLLQFVDSPDQAFRALRSSLKKDPVPWTEV